MPAVRPTRRLIAPSRALALLFVALALLSVAGCGALGKPKQNDALRRAQYDYSAAIRWGDIESAWNLVDPDYRKARPMSEAELSRYEQMQVTGYREGETRTDADGSVLREIQIDVVNRNTLTQRNLRYVERWRYDPDTKRWWIADGLPDFWAGQ